MLECFYYSQLWLTESGASRLRRPQDKDFPGNREGLEKVVHLPRSFSYRVTNMHRKQGRRSVSHCIGGLPAQCITREAMSRGHRGECSHLLSHAWPNSRVSQRCRVFRGALIPSFTCCHHEPHQRQLFAEAVQVFALLYKCFTEKGLQ